MIEKEYKALVTKRRFNIVKQYVHKIFVDSAPEVILQKNHYFAKLDLYSKGITLRIREMTGKYKLQLKQIKKENGNIRISDEYCIDINKLTEMIDNKLLPENYNASYYYLGTIQTKRTQFETKNNLCIDFDENSYFGITDYEIEIEFSDNLPQGLISIIENGMAPMKVEGKYSRFINKLKEINDYGRN